MNQRIALITDSSALLTAEQVAATGALIVPVTVTIDGVDHADGVDITAAGFYERMARGPAPTLSTAQPSPARFLEAYDDARTGGADSVLAVLVGSAYSGTLDSARLAAARSPIPVECVDTGLASFGVGLCALAAATALERGSTPVEARDHVLALAQSIESVFIIQAIELAQASGRFGPETLDQGSEETSIPVLALARGELSVIAEVTSPAQSVDTMADRVLESGVEIRVASGLADLATKPITDALEARLEASPAVVELLRYRVGPSVAANTGPGTAGVFWHPVEP